MSIESGVEIGSDCRIAAPCRIGPGAKLGDGCKVTGGGGDDPGGCRRAAGTDPLALERAPRPTRARGERPGEDARRRARGRRRNASGHHRPQPDPMTSRGATRITSRKEHARPRQSTNQGADGRVQAGRTGPEAEGTDAGRGRRRAGAISRPSGNPTRPGGRPHGTARGVRPRLQHTHDNQPDTGILAASADPGIQTIRSDIVRFHKNAL